MSPTLLKDDRDAGIGWVFCRQFHPALAPMAEDDTQLGGKQS
jgi:hypothetical protein